jgi:hypothetical protein
LLAPGASSYQLAQAYSTNNVFNWSTTGQAQGTWYISVWVKDAQSTGASGNPSGRWDAYTSLTHVLTGPSCSSVTASASPGSPSSAGTPVKVTATASGCTNAGPLYQFWLLAPGGSSYQLAQAYSANNIWNWNTTGLVPGTYNISVWAKDAQSTGLSGNPSGRWDAYFNFQFVITGPSCSAVGASPSPSSPRAAGTPVVVTATASCTNPSPLFQFWVLAPGASSWTLKQAYSTNNVFAWTTTGLAPGTYSISVWAKDAQSSGLAGNSSGRWDTYYSFTFTLT